MVSKIQAVAKFIAALIGTAVTAGTSLIPSEGIEWLTFTAAILTAVAVYVVPNVPVVKGPDLSGGDLTFDVK